MSARNPLRDPQAGDKIRWKGYLGMWSFRTVTMVSKVEGFVVSEEPGVERSESMSLRGWREFCRQRKAEAVE